MTYEDIHEPAPRDISVAARNAHRLTRTIFATFPKIPQDLAKRIAKYAKARDLAYGDALLRLVEQGLAAATNQCSFAKA